VTSYVIKSTVIFVVNTLEQRPQSLAVHLKLLASVQQVPNAEAFVGWTGMGATSSLIHSSKSHTDEISDTVEIDPQYAQALGFGQGDIVRSRFSHLYQGLIHCLKVEIGLLYDLPFAKSVGAEPLTADDWEIIVCIILASAIYHCSIVHG
jgi:peroxin-1